MCCACGGGVRVRSAPGCLNNAGDATDNGNDTCPTYDLLFTHYGDEVCLGHWDDDDFTVASQCCICGGGVSPSEPCMDMDMNALDSNGDACRNYEADWCGQYDDEDFSSSAMCCNCGGGLRGQSLPATLYRPEIPA